MKYIFFLVFFIFSFFSFADQKGSTTLKTTGQELTEQKVSGEDMCILACESEYNNCLNSDKKKADPCLSETSTCKKNCKKEAGNK